MTVVDYATWCGAREEATPQGEVEQTNQEMVEFLEAALKEGSEIDPPAELAEYHRAQLDVLEALISSLSLEAPDETFSPFSLFAVILMMGQHLEQAEEGLSAEVRSVLISSGCIEEDSPEPMPTATPEPTSAPTPTPIRPGFSPDNPIEAGGILDGSDGTKIVVLGIVPDDWPRMKSEEASAFYAPTPPKEDHRFLLVSVQVAYVSGTGTVEVSTSDFKILDDSRVLIHSRCGSSWNSIPDEIQGEVFVGGKVTGNVCFEVHKDASRLILIHQPDYSQESRRFLLVE